jgi:hypothetical protein
MFRIAIRKMVVQGLAGGDVKKMEEILRRKFKIPEQTKLARHWESYGYIYFQFEEEKNE